MAELNKFRNYTTRVMHRYHARRAARSDLTTSFVSVPEPRTIGIIGRGKQLAMGNFLFSGLLVEGPQTSIWDVADRNPAVRDELHGFGWLDDLAALGDITARNKAQTWLREWIVRFGNGSGPGWTPGITGRRLTRWINHGFFLLQGQDKAKSAPFFKSMAQQTLFLSRRALATPQGLQRFEALAGTVYAGLSLDGMQNHIDRPLAALAADCATQIDENGAIASRNPEELLEMLCLLNWTKLGLTEADRTVPPAITDAIARIVPVLRGLRHADGGLARFHGGGRGVLGRLDSALAQSGVRSPATGGLHMGFARLSSGRTTVIVDAALPPKGIASAKAHASTLGMELTCGRRPVIVNCGSGARFGANWLRAGRATPSHSTMMIDGVSTSRVAPRNGPEGAHDLLVDGPKLVQCNTIPTDSGRQLELSHDGYRVSHGLTHARILELSVDGRLLEGDDILTTLDATDEAAFGKALKSSVDTGVPFAIRFHLHPDVVPYLNAGGESVSLQLKSGETWVFRHDGNVSLSLSASVYLQNGRLKPRATQQVVLSGHALAYATRIRWSLAKWQDTPRFQRDLSQADPLDAID